MDQRLITDEERPHKRQRTEVSGEEAVAKYANVCLVNKYFYLLFS
jgi:U3 small nucleolar RNA-associated protein 20